VSISPEIDLDEAKALVNQPGWTSAVGHSDTAAVMSGLLGVPVANNRCFVSLQKGDSILVGQVSGRLPEGATTLPEGCQLHWFTVTVE